MTKKGVARRFSPDPALAAVLALGLLIRLYYARQPHVCFGDESCYIWLAQHLFGGEGYQYYNGVTEVHFPPLFPIALGIIHWVVRDWAAVTRAAYVLFGAAIPLPVYFLGRDMYGRRVARIAALSAAVLPAFTTGVLFAETLSEPLFLLCLFTAIRMAHRAATSERVRHCILAGVFFSLAYLTRPEAILFLGSCAFWVAMVTLLGPRERRMRLAAVQVAWIALAFLVVASPYLVFLRRQTGEWRLTTKGTTTYVLTRGLVHHDGIAFQKDTWGLDAKKEVNYYSHEFSKGLLELLLGPYRNRVVSDVTANVDNLKNTFLRPSFAGGALLAVALLGLVGAPWSRSRFRSELLNLMLLAPLGSLLVLYVIERFMYPALLPITFWASAGVARGLEWAELSELPGFLGGRAYRRALQAIGVAAFALYLAKTGHAYFQKSRNLRDDVWPAAEWLAKKTPAGSTVMTMGPEVAFHAGRRWLPVPYASREEVVSYGRKRGATFLCLRGYYLERRPEQKADLFDNAHGGEGLVLEYKSDAAGAAFVVYRLDNSGGGLGGVGGVKKD